MRYFILGLLIFLNAILVVQPLFAGEINTIGVPYIQNYSKAQYQFGNQNWAITKDENQIMYFANSGGLLSFDGYYWNRYRLPNQQIVRSVVADQKGKIYTGAFGEFGYWSHNKNKQFVYTSLTHLIPKDFALNEEVWKIYIAEEAIYFQTFGRIYVYKNNAISIIKSTNAF